MKSILPILRFTYVIAALAALPSVCCALPYFGTFTQTITNSNIPGINVGAEYYGYYTYESDTMDGTFATNYYAVPQTLDGFIFVPFASEVDTGYEFYNWGPGAYWTTLRNTMNAGIITIENGQVVDFLWSFEKGGFWVYANLSGFHAISFYDQMYVDREMAMPSVNGSMRFTGSPRVPESASSLGILALGFLGLGLVGRRICSIVG